MKQVNNLLQKVLFDPWDAVLTPKMKDDLLAGWEGLFRMVILELMPVDSLGEHFHPTMGRKTKELYSMAGLLLIREFNNWTMEETTKAYQYREDIHFALGMDPGVYSISQRTIERYYRYIIEDECAREIFTSVTQRLVTMCNTKIDKQRVDSTHLFSDMACYGRTRLMGIVIKRFLRQLKRHALNDYNDLPDTMRAKYKQSDQKLFADTVKKAEERIRVRQEIAEDLFFFVERYCNDPHHNTRATYQQMVQVFTEQCAIIEDKVCIKKKTGGAVIQNPSDPDATYDEHKGSGYQVQISETCNRDNEQQLITSVLPQTAVESDTPACGEVIEQLKDNKLLPQELLGDSLYGTDENVLAAAGHGIELVSPVKKGRENKLPDPDDINLSDFTYDNEQKTITHCLAGHIPFSSEYDEEKDQTTTYMLTGTCEACPRIKDCPVKKNRKSKGKYVLYTTPKKVRLTTRRLYNQTDEFKDRYRMRSGIEGTNSGLKRRTGIGRLRVRGKPRVFNAIIQKITGWNILRAAQCEKVQELVRKLYGKMLLSPFSICFRAIFPIKRTMEAIIETLRIFKGISYDFRCAA